MTVESLSRSSSPAALSEPPARESASYTVQRGDTFSTIARDHGVSVKALQDVNPQVLNPDVVYPDQRLALPEGAVAKPEALVAASGPTPVLDRDDRGAAVTELQAGLRSGGFDPGPADGIFGARTEGAVRAFQAERGLQVDGVVGRQTWSELGRTATTRPETPPVVAGEVPSTGDVSTDRRISALHPEVRATAAQFINRVEQELGITLRVTQGMRTFDEQNDLYAQGRTAPGDVVTNARGGQSYHNYGLAIDVVEIRADGSANWNTDWEAIGRIGEAMGMEWGGNWTSIVDRPHFQMDFGLSTSQLRQRIEGGNTGAGGFVNVH